MYILLERLFVRRSFKLQEQKDDEGGGKGDDTRPLGRFEAGKEASIVAAQEFEKEALYCIEHDIDAKDLSLFMWQDTVKEQEDKEENIDLPFPYFCRPKGLIAVGSVG